MKTYGMKVIFRFQLHVIEREIECLPHVIRVS